MSFVFGNAKVDRDHELMLTLSSNLVLSTIAERRKIMSTLLDYVTEHCNYEERFMSNIDYPGLEKHKELHRDLQDFIIDHFGRMLRANAGEKVLEIVHQEISDHILKEDSKIAYFFNGLKNGSRNG